ncbi:MAG: hypothetical protein MUQ51_01905 [Pseudomonadota bacterium]|nr:hypothetical protein [Pseudomonadota bacterium]MDO7667862.1 hypothetical protein [Pseudomonadota bacterium]MDO7710366.1 hypothetical protein [Pseudomonadota bacterium]
MLRSAGKLAGNPQALLINNERERANELNQLRQYVNDAETYDYLSKIKFYDQLLQLNQSLEKITLYRQQYFDNPSDNSKQVLINENSSFSDTLDNTIDLSRFGKYTEVDENALMPEKPEEKGQLSLNSTSSLTNRYSKELDNTTELAIRSKESQTKLNGSMDHYLIAIRVK